MHIVIYLPFILISILAHITVINGNFYTEHPVLFLLICFVCLLLIVIFIIKIAKLYGIIWHLIDDYFLQTKSHGSEKTQGTNPGSEPGPGTGPGGGGQEPYDIYPSHQKEPKHRKRLSELWSNREEIVYIPAIDEDGRPLLDLYGNAIFKDKYKNFYAKNPDGDYLRFDSEGNLTEFKNHGKLNPLRPSDYNPYEDEEHVSKCRKSTVYSRPQEERVKKRISVANRERYNNVSEEQKIERRRKQNERNRKLKETRD